MTVKVPVDKQFRHIKAVPGTSYARIHHDAGVLIQLLAIDACTDPVETTTPEFIEMPFARPRASRYGLDRKAHGRMVSSPVSTLLMHGYHFIKDGVFASDLTHKHCLIVC